MNTVTERLAVMVDELGGNVSQVAKRAGLDPQTLRKALEGKNKPSFDTLTAMLTAYPKYETNWLVLGKGPKLVNQPADPLPAVPMAGSMAAVPESDEVKQLKEDNRWLRDQLALWQRIATSGVDLSKVSTGTDGPFNSGNQDAADDYSAPMLVSHREPLAA